jgi:hypothetical protein
MIELGCRWCGTTLEASASTSASTLHSTGPYPTLILRCLTCGATWEQDHHGVVRKTEDPSVTEPVSYDDSQLVLTGFARI